MFLCEREFAPFLLFILTYRNVFPSPLFLSFFFFINLLSWCQYQQTRWSVFPSLRVLNALLLLPGVDIALSAECKATHKIRLLKPYLWLFIARVMANDLQAKGILRLCPQPSVTSLTLYLELFALNC